MGNSRLYGLGVLRIISMFGIIGLHILNAGGAFARDSLTSVYGLSVSVLYILCAASVNTFAMLTGYLYVDKPNVKYKNVLKLVFTVLFYSVIITALLMAFKPGAFGSILNIITSLIPPLAGKYWYITCYVLLFVLIPFINKLINSLTHGQFKLLIVLLVILTSVLPTFLLTDFFKLEQGYSSAWLIVCYFIGAYIKRSKQRLSTRTVLVLYLLCVITVIGVSVASWLVLKKFSVYNTLVEYTSPFIVLISVFSIYLFSKIQIKNKFLTKAIDSLSGSAFDAYILHGHPMIFVCFINDNFAIIRNLEFFKAISVILLSILAIYLMCWAVSQLKSLILKITRIDFLLDKFGYKIDCLLEKISNTHV